MLRRLAFLTVLIASLAAQAHARAPTADEVVARAKVLGVGRQAEQLAGHFLPGARLLAGGTGSVGQSRLGGRPDLPSGWRWPRCHGKPLMFLAQLNLDELAAVAPGQTSARGMLYFFGAAFDAGDGVVPLEEFYGYTRAGACVVTRHTAATSLHRRTAPRGAHALKSLPVTLSPRLMVPSSDVAAAYLHAKSLPEAWYELSDETIEGKLEQPDPDDYSYAPAHLALGWDTPIQDDPVYGCGDTYTNPPKNRLLFQLDNDDSIGFDYGDAGALYFVIPPADLAAGRFSRVCAIFDDG